MNEVYCQLKKVLTYFPAGEVSWELKGYLTGMNIEDCFDEFFGPDLINVAKEGVVFYKRIFQDVGIDPKTALVIDDSVEKLSFALELGASTVHVLNSSRCRNSAYQHHIDQLKELPILLPEINVQKRNYKDLVNFTVTHRVLRWN